MHADALRREVPAPPRHRDWLEVLRVRVRRRGEQLREHVLRELSLPPMKTANAALTGAEGVRVEGTVRQQTKEMP